MLQHRLREFQRRIEAEKVFGEVGRAVGEDAVEFLKELAIPFRVLPNAGRQLRLPLHGGDGGGNVPLYQVSDGASIGRCLYI